MSHNIGLADKATSMSDLSIDMALKLFSNVMNELIKYIRERAKRGETVPVIYFTAFLYEPVNRTEGEAFINNIISKYRCESHITPLFQKLDAPIICVGRSSFAVQYTVTTYEELLSAESQLEMIEKALSEGVVTWEFPLAEELGLSRGDIERLADLIKDLTLILYPVEAHTEDLVEVLRHLYEESKEHLPTEDRVVKIEVYAQPDKLIDIEKRLRERFKQDVRIYSSRERIVIIPRESIMLDRELYATILYKYNFISYLKRCIR